MYSWQRIQKMPVYWCSCTKWTPLLYITLFLWNFWWGVFVQRSFPRQFRCLKSLMHFVHPIWPRSPGHYVLVVTDLFIQQGPNPVWQKASRGVMRCDTTVRVVTGRYKEQYCLSRDLSPKYTVWPDCMEFGASSSGWFIAGHKSWSGVSLSLPHIHQISERRHNQGNYYFSDGKNSSWRNICWQQRTEKGGGMEGKRGRRRKIGRKILGLEWSKFFFYFSSVFIFSPVTGFHKVGGGGGRGG